MREIIFGRGVYVDKNTSQAASVEFVCRRPTNSARSRLQKIWRKAPKGIFDTLKRACGHAFLHIGMICPGSTYPKEEPNCESIQEVCG
jgi:hypothetical protein